ncbi:MAG: Crp/Fnr family transcriptional regulator [Deltaproteobacteria bacterium]|jgi:CRP/FNR family transcriptional regulator|nr:Crp/Fnr family transcriptional regulator [Deltaproteobacteria bacterium]
MRLTEDPSPREIINQSFFFSGLPPETTDQLAGITLVKKYPKGSLLFSRGQKATGFYLLGQGQIQIFFAEPNGRERVVKIVHPGEIFGEAAIFQTKGYPASALALSPALVLFWPQRELKALLRSDGDLALAMIGVLANKLEHFASLVRLSLKEALAKVAEYLLSLPREADQLQTPPAKSVMALAIGITAESFSRALGQLKKARLIAEAPQLTILDRTGLSLVAAGALITTNPREPSGS